MGTTNRRMLARGCARIRMLQRAPIRTLTQMPNVHSTTSPEPAALSAPPTEIRLYKGSFLMPLRILLRAKLAQLGAASACALPIATSAMGGDPSAEMLAMSGAILSGCGVASWAMYFYGRRYVGLLTLMVPERQLRISTLSFWGLREDNVIDLSRVVAPFEGLQYKVMSSAAQYTFFPMILADDRTYIMTLRWWPLEKKFIENTTEKQLLVRLLRGKLNEEVLLDLESTMNEPPTSKPIVSKSEAGPCA